MNSASPEPGGTKSSGNKKDHPSLPRFGGRRVHNWAVFSALGVITAVLLAVIGFLDTSYQIVPETAPVHLHKGLKRPVFPSKKHKAADNLTARLKQYGLWKIQPFQEVPRFFIESYPDDLHNIKDISLRKRMFLHALLPHALYVRQEVLHKRNRLESIVRRIDCPLVNIDFAPEPDDANSCLWTDYLTEEETDFIRKLSRNYRTTTAQELLERVDAVPVSIILAQGALESSWGSSRFSREGNGIFGMWTWQDKGMVPERREQGKTHKVRSYNTIREAVRAYQLTLNRLDPYEEFRQLRSYTDNPLIIAEGLTLYSERGEEYVEEIKQVILHNDLQKYDTCRLSDLDIEEFSGPVEKAAPVSEPEKASL